MTEQNLSNFKYFVNDPNGCSVKRYHHDKHHTIAFEWIDTLNDSAIHAKGSDLTSRLGWCELKEYYGTVDNAIEKLLAWLEEANPKCCHWNVYCNTDVMNQIVDAIKVKYDV